MELLDIEPLELKFPFELKKNIPCSVHLVNRTNEYVAFKVKTSSPKSYSVRPNPGVILPRSTRDIKVNLQAQKTAPPDMQLKDTFLIQSTIAPYGSGDVDIPVLFSKTNGGHIEEKKLRVVLVSPPNSPGLQSINGALKQEQANEAPLVKETTILKYQAPLSGVKNLPQVLLSGVENLPPPNVKDGDDIILKIDNLETKLNEVLLNTRSDARVQVGFPFLFVVFMALVGALLVGVLLGYLLRHSEKTHLQTYSGDYWYQ